MVTSPRSSCLRWMALLQSVVLLPPLIVGSICPCLDGPPRAELGICACQRVDGHAAESPLAGHDTLECGACGDHVLTALVGSRPTAGPAAMVLERIALLASTSPLLVRPITPASSVEGPPGRSLPNLRC